MNSNAVPPAQPQLNTQGIGNNTQGLSFNFNRPNPQFAPPPAMGNGSQPMRAPSGGSPGVARPPWPEKIQPQASQLGGPDTFNARPPWPERQSLMASSPIQAKSGFGGGNGSIAGFLGSMGNKSGAAPSWQMNNVDMGGSQDLGSTNRQLNNYMVMYQPRPGKTGTEVGAAYNRQVGEMQYGDTSDKKAKKNIESDGVENKIQGMLDKLKAYEYSYRDPELPGRGEGRHTSVMAQDLEKSELGKTAVMETPNGKMVNYGKLGAINLAGLAMLNERLDQVERTQAKAAVK